MRLGVMAFWPEYAPIYHELRVSFYRLTACLGSEPTWDADVLDYVRLAAEHGMAPVVDLRFPRSLLSDKSITAEFAMFCGGAAKSLPQCSDFAIWEEPSCPAVGLTAEATCYGAILAAAASAVKNARPDACVYNGGMGVNGDAWGVKALHDYGALDSVDAVNVHPFVFEEGNLRFKGQMRRMFGELRYVPKPVVVTEWGVPSSENAIRYPSYVLKDGVFGVSEEEQARRIAWAMRLFKEEGVRMCCIFLKDWHNLSRDHWSFHCGLLRADGTAKPAYGAMHRWRAENE